MFLSEEESEDIVVEILCRKMPIKRTIRQIFHYIRKFAVGVTVDDRDLIPFGARIGPIISKLRPRFVAMINDTGILHLNINRRLEIYVLRDSFKETLELKP